MAKMQGRMQGKVPQGDDRGDGLREKMVAINRVTKVVKGRWRRWHGQRKIP